jgi:hypothetical protein
MEPKTIKEEQQRDHALYFVEDGEAGFSPEYNKMVIDRTIKKSLENRRKKRKAYVESIRERSDAVVTYLKHIDTGKSTPVERYFSREELARLRGQKILERVKSANRQLYIPGN